MEEKKIARINELANKAKTPAGLTPAEVGERDALRREYLDNVRQNLTAQLDQVRIVEADGAKHPLRKKEENA